MIVALWGLCQLRAAKPGIRILGDQGMAQESHQAAKNFSGLVPNHYIKRL